LAHLLSNVDRYISGPSFSGIEDNDADRVVELALDQITDQGLAISGVFSGLAPASPEPAKVIQHEVSVLLRPMGRNRWRGTQHNQLPKPTEKAILLRQPGNSVTHARKIVKKIGPAICRTDQYGGNKDKSRSAAADGAPTI
jgi:hypothetical protein